MNQLGCFFRCIPSFHSHMKAPSTHWPMKVNGDLIPDPVSYAKYVGVQREVRGGFQSIKLPPRDPQKTIKTSTLLNSSISLGDPALVR